MVAQKFEACKEPGWLIHLPAQLPPPVVQGEQGLLVVVFQLPNKDQVEVFGPSGPNQHFVPDTPVCGFLVDDMEQARNGLIQAGIELIGPLHTVPSGYAWQHFRGPNGTIYELTYDPESL